MEGREEWWGVNVNAMKIEEGGNGGCTFAGKEAGETVRGN